MSGQHVSDMAMSFVEMAKAFEELPKVKAELAEANRAFNHASDTIQRLELKLIDRNTTIDELHAKVREAEVARDDAELRFLEADEKLGHVAKALQAAGETVGLALRKPEPVVAEPIAELGSTSAAPSYAYASDGAISPEPGQSVADPTVQSDSTNQPIASSTTAEPVEPVQPTPSGSSEVPPEPFSPESKPSDPVEVREGPRPSVVSAEGVSTEAQTANVQDVVESTSGQSDPLPTVASPIDGSTAGNTNANPSADVSSPIDDPSYANEPHDKWSVAWTKWAERMDAKFGRYNWPIRSQFATANHIS